MGRPFLFSGRFFAPEQPARFGQGADASRLPQKQGEVTERHRGEQKVARAPDEGGADRRPDGEQKAEENDRFATHGYPLIEITEAFFGVEGGGQDGRIGEEKEAE